MGHRLSKIVTRTGDDGTTGLADGSRIDKHSLQIECLGQLDELNSLIGYILSFPNNTHINQCLTRIQHVLFEVGGELSLPSRSVIDESHIKHIELLIQEFNSHLDPLKNFILPGGSTAGSLCHMARTVCRRVERRMVSLKHEGFVNPNSLCYLNRLSDLLFVIARTINLEQNHVEQLWEQNHRQN